MNKLSEYYYKRTKQIILSKESALNAIRRDFNVLHFYWMYQNREHNENPEYKSPIYKNKISKHELSRIQIWYVDPEKSGVPTLYHGQGYRYIESSVYLHIRSIIDRPCNACLCRIIALSDYPDNTITRTIHINCIRNC